MSSAIPKSPRSKKESSQKSIRVLASEDGARVLNPDYKLLSEVRSTPRAVMTGKGSSYGGGSLSLDGTLMSSQTNTIFGGGGSPSMNNTLRSTTTSNAAEGGAQPSTDSLAASGRRIPAVPGPGAYVMPQLWTPTKGPIRWHRDLYPTTGGSNSTSPRHSPRNNGDAGGALYLPATPKGKAFSMSSRCDGPQPNHSQLPGPGSYEPLPSQFSPNKHTKRCVFGMRTKPLRSPLDTVPGPGAYEIAQGPADRFNSNGASYKTTTLSGKWADPTPPKAPHALTYHVPAPFDKPLEGHVPTIKGRLDHPMEDKNVSHEAAKTDRPHDFSKRMKMRPVA